MNKKGLRKEKIKRKKEFDKLFYTRILPTIDEYKYEYRRLKKVFVILLFLILLLLFIVLIILFPPTTFIRTFLAILLPVYFLYISLYFTNFKISFSCTLKKHYAKDILSLFGNISCSEYSVSNDLLEKSGMFKFFNQRFTDDSFIIEYENSRVFVSELLLRFSSRIMLIPSFKGVVVAFDVDKKFNGNTIISSKSDFISSPLCVIISVIITIIVLLASIILFYVYPKLAAYLHLFVIPFVLLFDYYVFYGCNESRNKVNLEDINLMKKFKIETTGSQIEARYLLTPAFIQRYMTLKNAFGNKPIKCAFFNNMVMFAIPANGNLFEIGYIYKSLKNPDSFYKYYNQISSIIDFVEHFKKNV